jgi:light-regulated signal transduction histidine kinase (bacteriophytochrome)
MKPVHPTTNFVSAGNATIVAVALVTVLISPLVLVFRRQKVAGAAACGREVEAHEVRENGIGIVPVLHSEPLSIFQRLHCGEAYAGARIGRPKCRSFVEFCIADVNPRSTPEVGSQFLSSLSSPRM